MRLIQLAQEPRLLALPRAHRFADRTSLTMSELAHESFVVNPAARENALARWRSEQRRHGLPGRIAAEARSITELLTMVAAGTGVALVPATIARHHDLPEITYVPVLDADPAVISLAWAAGSLRSSGEAFVETARAQARDGWIETPDVTADAGAPASPEARPRRAGQSLISVTS